MKKECRVHGFPDDVVTAEGEGYIGYTSGDPSMRKVLFDPSRCFNEIDGIVVVLLNTRSDCEDIGIKNDVFRWKIYLLDEDSIGPLADSYLVLIGCGLSLLVKCHYHDRRSKPADNSGLFDKFIFPLLQGNRIKNAFPLKALNSCLKNLPL